MVISPVPVIIITQTTREFLESVQRQAKPSLCSSINVQEAVASGNLTAQATLIQSDHNHSVRPQSVSQSGSKHIRG